MTNAVVTAAGVVIALLIATAPLESQTTDSAGRRVEPYEFIPAVAHQQSGSGFVSIVPVSARSDMASGGDVLLRIEATGAVDAASVRVERNGRDVTTAFRPARDGRGILGLVEGLEIGDNTIRVTAEGSPPQAAELTITNYPAWGPVFAGPHEQPFYCTTHIFQTPSGGTLGEPLDEHCSVERRVTYVYRTNDGEMEPLVDTGRLPDDMSYTNVGGEDLPFVVRIETGTANRAIYQIAMLHDPREPDPDPWTRSAGWNGRLIYRFGGGCRPGWYNQGNRTGGVLPEAQLARGYAIASSTLSVFANNCSELLSAETMMLVRERFIEAFGAPLFTMGWGSSGGAHQQMGIADNYPGLLDGLIVGSSFPDMTSGTVFKSVDARLLEHYFGEVAPGRFTEDQQRAVSGFSSVANIPAMSVMARRSDPTADFPDVLPVEERYDPSLNPTGARATIYDHTVNVYGRDPVTGFARRPLDNVGVQYGLGALNDGTIDFGQFLDLNEGIGGVDMDFRPQEARTIGEADVISAAYRTGRIISGKGLANVAILDYRTFLDHRPNGDNHMKFHSFSLRERLIRENGHADNHVLLVVPRGGSFGMSAASNEIMNEAVAQLDEWLTRVAQDASSDPLPQRIVRARPSEFVDACWTEDGRRIEEIQSYDGPGECGELYPSYSTPALVAGAPLVDDIVKCQLKPIDPADYAVAISVGEWSRLEATFPDGVCDWTKPGVAQESQLGMWLRAVMP